VVRYKIVHTTSYNYSDAVPVCHNLLLLTPRNTAHSHCEHHRILVQPQPRLVNRRCDFHGNVVHSFSIEESHMRLRVVATSRVAVRSRDARPGQDANLPWEVVRDQLRDQQGDWWDASPYMFNSPRIRRSEEFADYAGSSFLPERPLFEACRELTTRIYQDFTYDAEATEVTTTPEAAMKLKKGVCQDFSQIQIACLRSIGLAARYVSGYLRTHPVPGKSRLIGADQSHAWVSVYQAAGDWLDLDPTNDVVCGEEHIPVAWGRDYSDVVPFRGVFIGGGSQTMHVSVEVTPVA
jgi:transglutaminase-like putative cysteine protease